MSVPVTAISRHICYLSNIGGKFCFSLPEDSTVKVYYCIFMIVPCLCFCREIQDTTASASARTRHETAPLKQHCDPTPCLSLSQFLSLSRFGRI